MVFATQRVPGDIKSMDMIKKPVFSDQVAPLHVFVTISNRGPPAVELDAAVAKVGQSITATVYSQRDGHGYLCIKNPDKPWQCVADAQLFKDQSLEWQLTPDTAGSYEIQAVWRPNKVPREEIQLPQPTQNRAKQGITVSQSDTECRVSVELLVE